MVHNQVMSKIKLYYRWKGKKGQVVKDHLEVRYFLIAQDLKKEV